MREAGSGTRLIAMSQFERRGLAPKISMELSDDEAIKEAILAGLGVAIMSRFTLGLEPEPSRLICNPSGLSTPCASLLTSIACETQVAMHAGVEEPHSLPNIADASRGVDDLPQPSRADRALPREPA